MRFRFQAEQQIPYPLEAVFAFFADPDNLPRLMPAWQDARIETATYIAPPPPSAPFPGSDRIIAGTGTRLSLTIRPFPFSPMRITWEAAVEDFTWLRGFCDTQLRGPFKYWRHCHTLTSAASDTHLPCTLLQDAVEYELPLGPLGSLANTLFIRRQLASTFAYRHQRTLDLLASAH